MKNIFILVIILTNLTLLAQEKEKIAEHKKWGFMVGLTNRTPTLNILYGMNKIIRITLSIRKQDTRNTNILLDGSDFIYSYRWDTWYDSYSSRNVIAPGLEWGQEKGWVYGTVRLGYEDYEYKSHNHSFYHESSNGYTSYRNFDIKTNRKRIFGELGAGFRYYFWDSIILGWEVGGRKIFSSQYKSNSHNDITFHRNNIPTLNYPTTYSDEKFKTFDIYFSLNLGIAF